MTMIAEEAAKGIAQGINAFLKRSLTITALFILLAGTSYSSYALLQINATDRQHYMEALSDYSKALNGANEALGKVQIELAVCAAERTRQAAEIINLQFKVDRLEKKR